MRLIWRPPWTEQQAWLAQAKTAAATFDAERRDAVGRSYSRLERSIDLGSGRRRFEAASVALLAWRMHERAGMTVAASTPLAETGTTVLLSLRLGPVALPIPCRVDEVVKEPARRGFSYVTLPGHPEQGWESFVVTISPAGSVRFTVSAVSRPASRIVAAAGPLAGAVQRLAVWRYLHGMRDLARSGG